MSPDRVDAAPPRLRVRVLRPDLTLLVCDRMPHLEGDQVMDWVAGRELLAARGVLAVRFDHPVELEGE